jgi:hypothetical protein
MNTRWYTVKNCHKTLSLLLGNIQSRKASTNGLLAVQKPEGPSPIIPSENADRPSKRRRTETNPPKVQMAGIRRQSTSNKEDHDVTMDAVSPLTSTPGNTASNVSSPAMNTSNNNSATSDARTAAGLAAARQKHTPSGWSNSSIDASANPTHMYDLSQFINPTPPPGMRRSNNDPALSGGKAASLAYGSGSALYNTQQEMAFAHSSMQLQDLPSMNTTSSGQGMTGMMDDPDPMFWGNADFALADVFGSAAWEQMTAGTPRGTAGQGGPWDGLGGV